MELSELGLLETVIDENHPSYPLAVKIFKVVDSQPASIAFTALYYTLYRGLIEATDDNGYEIARTMEQYWKSVAEKALRKNAN
jgi:hypothetical protein